MTFKVTDKAGNPVDISKITYIRVVLSGPNVDYQVGTGGIRVSEDPSKTPGSGGVYTYTMTNKIPAAAAGSYTVSLEARNSVTLMPGTTKQTTATDSAKPVEFYFSVDKSKMVARRVVVTTEKCAACHVDLTLGPRRQPRGQQECVTVPQPDADGWHLQAERQFCDPDPQYPSRQGPGESVRAGHHQLSGSGIPGRPARLHHLPRYRLLPGRQRRRSGSSSQSGRLYAHHAADFGRLPGLP